MQNLNAYYINVFKDAKGEITQSENGVMDTEGKARQEAVDYVLNHGWTYVDTLSNYSHRVDFTPDIKDAQYERDYPDASHGRLEDEAIWRKQLREVTGQSVNCGMSCQWVQP